MNKTNIIKNTMKRVNTTEANVNMVLDYIEANIGNDLKVGTLTTLTQFICLYAYNFIDLDSEDFTEEAIAKAAKVPAVEKLYK